MKEKRIEKIMTYLKNNYPEYSFGWNYQNEEKDFILIFAYDKETSDYVKGCIVSTEIRLTKKRYKDIEKLLKLEVK